jgi:hypothetical protein
MTGYTPTDVAVHYRTPYRGGPPTLEQQFPRCGLTVFESGFRLLRGLYDSERERFECKYDLIFVEFRFDHRHHPLAERPNVVAIRREFMVQEQLALARACPDLPDKITEESLRKIIAAANETDLELLIARRYRWQNMTETPASDGVELGSLTEPLATIAHRAQELYRETSAEHLNNRRFCRAMTAVEDLLDRCTSLAEQCHCISRGQDEAERPEEHNDVGC